MNSHYLTIPGFTIAYRTWGKPENPPIVALHGWLDNANSFEPLAPYLQDNFYLIAIDFPGHGHSSHLPQGCYYHFMDGILNFMQVLDALHLKKVHLLGHSMGACLASLVAGVTPKRFLSLALIEGLGPFSHPADTACKQLTDYLDYLASKETKKAKGYPSLEKAALARAQRGYVSLDLALTLCERGLKEEKGCYFWRHDSRLLVPSPLRMTEEQILSFLTEITAKTCLIVATDGFSFDSKLMQQRVKAVKELQVMRLKGGHHIHMEEPNLLGKILTDYFMSC